MISNRIQGAAYRALTEMKHGWSEKETKQFVKDYPAASLAPADREAMNNFVSVGMKTTRGEAARSLLAAYSKELSQPQTEGYPSWMGDTQNIKTAEAFLDPMGWPEFEKQFINELKSEDPYLKGAKLTAISIDPKDDNTAVVTYQGTDMLSRNYETVERKMTAEVKNGNVVLDTYWD